MRPAPCARRQCDPPPRRVRGTPHTAPSSAPRPREQVSELSAADPGCADLRQLEEQLREAVQQLQAGLLDLKKQRLMMAVDALGGAPPPAEGAAGPGGEPAGGMEAGPAAQAGAFHFSDGRQHRSREGAASPSSSGGGSGSEGGSESDDEGSSSSGSSSGASGSGSDGESSGGEERHGGLGLGLGPGGALAHARWAEPRGRAAAGIRKPRPLRFGSRAGRH